jgi:hypothetical protein
LCAGSAGQREKRGACKKSDFEHLLTGVHTTPLGFADRTCGHRNLPSDEIHPLRMQIVQSSFGSAPAPSLASFELAVGSTLPFSTMGYAGAILMIQGIMRNYEGVMTLMIAFSYRA